MMAVWTLAAWLSLCAAPERLSDALALEQRGGDTEALELVEAVVKSRPDWEIPRLEAARLRLKLGRGLDLALAHLEAARSLAPENPRGHFLYGLLMEERREVRTAIDAHELALTYRTDYHEARFRLAGLYFGLGEWALAERHYRICAQAHPDATGARLQLATTLERQGKLEDTELELSKLFVAQPKSQVVGRRLVELYERTGRLHLADKVRRQLGERPRRQLRELKKSRR
ncbi:MAG: hypothetical protein ACOZIN_07650 [Myxococcota bacterium]